MTEQPVQNSLGTDMSHPAVGKVQAWLTTARHRTPQGEFCLATFRVPNSTLTTMLTKAELAAWIKQLQSEHDKMSSLTLAPPGAVLPPMNGQPQ